MKNIDPLQPGGIADIKECLSYRFDEDNQMFTSEWSYRKCDPLVVDVKFPEVKGGEGAEWELGRDLIAKGLIRNNGEADVRIKPKLLEMFMTLSSDNENVTLVFGRLHVARFIFRTYQAVQLAEEKRILVRQTDQTIADIRRLKY